MIGLLRQSMVLYPHVLGLELLEVEVSHLLLSLVRHG